MKKEGNILNRILAKDNMPGILHDARGNIIRQVVLHDPIIEPFIVAQRPFQNLVP